MASAFALLLSAVPVSAQDEDEGWIVTIGAGGQVIPEYPGAEDSAVIALPVFGYRRAGEPLPVKAPDDGVAIGVLSLLGKEGPVDFGPVLNFQLERDPENVGAAVPKVETTIEAGAFAHIYILPNLRLRAEGRFGLGGHDGFVGALGADYVHRRDEVVFTIGPRARFSDSTYQGAYFGVSNPVAGATRLPAFEAGQGFHAVGAITGMSWQFDRNWGLYGYAGYDRLIGDAKDSPIVRQFGSPDQFSGGLGLTYSFGIAGFLTLRVQPPGQRRTRLLSPAGASFNSCGYKQDR